MVSLGSFFLCLLVGVLIGFPLYRKTLTPTSLRKPNTVVLDKALYLSLQITLHVTQCLVNLSREPRETLTALTIESAQFETLPISRHSTPSNRLANRSIKVSGIFRDEHGVAIHSVMILFLISLNDVWQPAPAGHCIKITGYNHGLGSGSFAMSNPCYVEFNNPSQSIEPTFISQEEWNKRAKNNSFPSQLPFTF
ncbi:MAG: hypothetical protein RIQ54_142 [Candidatus Parcubacteria bacterium]|jgi:hypothetical protein